MKSIFAVDDSSTVRAMLGNVLIKAGYSLHFAEDGVIALDMINKSSYKIDLFIFDVNMPNMDGIALIKDVRKISKFKYTPVLFLTSESQLVNEGKLAGATGWIVKPINDDLLLSVIKRFIK
ncbi:MAG: response regulator [Spirochaetaceae bacterium]